MLRIIKHKIILFGVLLFLFGTTGLSAQISFSGLPDCDDNGGTVAAANSMYVHIAGITNVDGVNELNFTANTASATALTVSEIGTGIGATDSDGTLLITGLTSADLGTTINLILENNGNSISIEIPVAICGFNVDTNGNGNIENDISNGTFCSDQNGMTAPGILAQVLPNTAVASENDITSTYVYVLVDNTDSANIEATNTTGLFDSTDGVENLHDYTMYAFYVSNAELATFNAALTGLSMLSAGDAILTNTGAFANFCYSFCCEASFSPYCCNAEAGDITNTNIASCVGSADLAFMTNLGADSGGDLPNTSAEYSSVFLAVEGGTIQAVSTDGTFDFSTYTGALPITYTIYSLNYRTLEINNFTNINGGLITELMGTAFATLQNDINLVPSATQVCAELTDADFTVTIYEEPAANPMTGTTCLGGYLDVDGQVSEGIGSYTHNWTIVAGANTTATDITLTNDNTGTVRVNSNSNGTAGTVELQYTVADGNACSTTVNVIVTIDPCGAGTGDDVMLDDPCECLNNATTELDGQFSEVLSVFSFAAGQDWYIQSVNSFNNSGTLPNDGLFDPNSAAPPTAATPFTIGSAGVLFTDASSDGIDNDGINGIDDADEIGLYYLNAVHYDGLGFVVTIANDALGVVRTITNRGCYYPNPVITTPATLCQTALPFDLSGAGSALQGSDNTPASLDANGDPFYTNGAAFFNDVIAGNFPAGGTFDLYDSTGNLVFGNINVIPSNLPSTGTYTLTYTFNEEDVPPNPQPMGTDLDIGPFDRGCVQTTSIDIQINLVDCNSFPWNGQN